MKLIHIHGVWPLYTNTFLLITAAGHAVVVDPAAEAETYLAQLKENNATLTDIFLTHGHYDHVGSVALRCIWTRPMSKATRCIR